MEPALGSGLVDGDPPASKSEDGGFGTRRGAGFVEYRTHMELNCAVTNPKPVGDLPIGEALSSESEHLLLARGKRMIIEGFMSG